MDAGFHTRRRRWSEQKCLISIFQSIDNVGLTAMPKIVRFYQTGPAEVLQIEDLPQQEPKENEVRLKIQAIGLNRAEIMFRTGTYLERPVFPACLGLEAAGIVDAVGDGVTVSRSGSASVRCLHSQ